ncbi:c-type cytochrome biogenesis protein CcsB [Yinghuangia sp. ASG 101]|uniref:c-type cytochrome biogenesis protein CcsB n=1 Tax=Yinghuangia sp. ASG 101 TaxID=2896848 RepID=UPI001E313815|nr:c-type cytochrome biogenesis protein CcsB [Yinghuangia sp. ASG 101]UGQ15429.1 c-type cytochrome biogenesis protein CcsB [Yinghuangia sp. ASG 101]
MYSAIAVYMLAFFAYCAEWVFGGRSRVARESAALAPRSEAAEPVRAIVPAATLAAARGGVAVAERPVVTTTAPAPPEAGKVTVVVRDGGHDGGSADDAGDVTGGDERSDRFGRIAVSFTVLAFLLHAGTLMARGFAVKRAPWGNMYEFSVSVSLMVVAAFLILLTRRKVRWLGLFVLLPVITTLGIAVSVLYTDSQQLVPALHSYWLWIHVSSAIVSFGALHIGALASILYLMKDSYNKRMAASAQPKTRPWDTVMERIPAPASLDKTAYRVNALIFPLWTFAVVAGAIWAENAWGRYWGWDPKETWSFITWVAYAAYLHARATGGWKGRNAAWLSLFAFACFLFNYYGVNIFVNGLHSYAGV